MARINVTIETDMDGLRDVMRQVEAIYEVVKNLRGERFRALERQILALGDDGGMTAPEVTMVEGVAIPSAPKELTAILVHARSLGLVR